MSAGDGQYGAASCAVDVPTGSNPNCFTDRRDTTGPTFSVRVPRVYVDGSQTTAAGRRRPRRRGVRDYRTGYVPGSPAYPATGEELINSLGDPEIPVDPPHTVALSTAIDRAGSDAFESEQALSNELHPVFEAQRAETSIGVLGSLRATLPFRALDPAELLAVQREEHIREDAEHEQLDAEQKGDPRDDCEHFV